MAKHYLGWTEDLGERLQRHRARTGAAIMKAVVEAGIGWEVVKTWEGGRDLERKLKRQKNAKRYCPICQAVGFYEQ